MHVLTPIQMALLRYAAEGMTHTDIARALGLEGAKEVAGKYDTIDHHFRYLRAMRVVGPGKIGLGAFFVEFVLTPDAREWWTQKDYVQTFLANQHEFTPCQQRVIRVVGNNPGISNSHAGKMLFICAVTVDSHLKCLYRKLGYRGKPARAQLTLAYRLQGLVKRDRQKQGIG